MTREASQPLVSVCIPTYNRADRLARAISALQASTHSNLEIIISDNASSDQTEKTCRALAATDCRIRYHRHPVNCGPTSNFNFAKSLATGKYFLWHGDDDYLEANYIASCVARLEEDESLILVSGVAKYQMQDGSVTYGNIIELGAERPLVRILRYILEVGENSIFCGACRRAEVADLTMPNELSGDWVWIASVLGRGRAQVLPGAIVHRDYGDTTSSSYKRICRSFGLPARHAKLFPYYMARNLACLTVLPIGSNPRKSQFSNAIARALIWILTFFKFPLQRALRALRRLVAGRAGGETY